MGRAGAEKADAADGEWTIVGHGRLPEQRLGDRGAEALGDGEQLLPGTERTAAGEDHWFLAGIEDLDRARELLLARHAARMDHQVGNMPGDVALRALAG